jgi:hypothetical protein
LLAIGPLGLMAGGPEDHLTGSRELYGLVEGDEWAHVEALDPDAGFRARRFAQLVNWRARGRESRDRAIVPSAAELVEQLKEIARQGRATPRGRHGRLMIPVTTTQSAIAGTHADNAGLSITSNPDIRQAHALGACRRAVAGSTTRCTR